MTSFQNSTDPTLGKLGKRSRNHQQLQISLSVAKQWSYIPSVPEVTELPESWGNSKTRVGRENEAPLGAVSVYIFDILLEIILH